MPRNRLSNEEKYKVKERIELVLGRTRLVDGRRPDWRLTIDRRICLFITFSVFNEKTDKTWYDINQNDMSQWRRYERSFVIFVMGDSSQCLVVPVPALETSLNHLTPAGDGSYKLHIKESRGRYEFIELPQFDLAPFYNSFDSLAL